MIAASELVDGLDPAAALGRLKIPDHTGLAVGPRHGSQKSVGLFERELRQVSGLEEAEEGIVVVADLLGEGLRGGKDHEARMLLHQVPQGFLPFSPEAAGSVEGDPQVLHQDQDVLRAGRG